MKPLIQSLRRLFLGCLCGTAALSTAPAATVYDSGGFESPVFIAGQPLASQDPAPPVGNGPWRKDAGTSTAEVVAVNPVQGSKSVKITRSAGTTGDTRWAVVKPTSASGLDNVINLDFDMRVLRTANSFGPLFGMEAYDSSIGNPKLIGSLLIDAGSGEIVCHKAVTGAHIGTGAYPDLVLHHHYRMSINFTAKTCSLFADGRRIHTENFVDPTATSFTDASLVTLATGSGNESGTAYVDNYRIEQTTSQLPYLLWQGDGIANAWNTSVAPNWYDGFTPVAYSNGKPVRFEDGGSTTPAVNVQGSVLPASVAISATQNYALAGSGSIGGSTSLLKEGSGKLTMSNANAYSGDTDLRGGELSVRNTTGSATGSSKVTVFPMCTFSGNGSVAGSLWVASGGVIKPGADGTGTLSVGGILVLDNAALKYELGTASDRIAVAGDLTLGGTLEVTTATGFGPGSYNLITYGGALNAGALQVTAPSGYDYRIDTATVGMVKLLVTLPPPAPSAPTGLAATAAGTQAINLAWTDQSNNEDSFVIERGADSTTFSPIATVASNVSTFSNTGLTPGSTYYYRVRAVNAGGQSPYSNSASATTASSPVTARYEFELTTLDSSGNNNHGAAAGTVLYGPGRVGANSVTFDGTGFIEIPRVVDNNFTVMMWVKTTANATGGAWYSGMGLVDGETVGSAADWGCSILNSKFAFGVGAPDTTISSKRSVNDGLWHHVAATRNNETGEVKIYIDGVLDALGAAPTGPRTAPTQLRIGATQTARPVFYVGGIDDLRFYGSRLNQAEIADIAAIPGPPPPPVGDPVVIWPLGDSITWGYTTASAADSPGGYREPLYRNLLVNGYPAMKFVGANASNPGPLLTRDSQVNHDGYPQYTLTEINANLNANAPTGKTRGNNGGFWLTGTGGRPAINPDIVLLLAGTNDIEDGAAAPLIEQRLDAMVNKIFTLRPGTKIFLASIPPYPADAAKTATAKAYNQLMRSLTVPKYLSLGYDIRFVDQYANFIASSSPAGDVVISGLYGDTIHPNESGYQLMGNTWADALFADPVPLPAAPANLAATAPTVGAVQLEWSDLATNEGAFMIERSANGGNFAVIGHVAADQTTYIDSSVAAFTGYQYRVTARNSSGDSSASNVASIITPGNFEGWKKLKFTTAELLDSAISGSLADPERDGITNLEEYAFDGNPKAANRQILPLGEIQNGHLVVTFTRMLDRTDISYTALAGSDLVAFTPVAKSTLGAPTVPMNGGAVSATPDAVDNKKESVAVRDNTPVSGAPTRFMRIEIQRPD